MTGARHLQTRTRWTAAEDRKLLDLHEDGLKEAETLATCRLFSTTASSQPCRPASGTEDLPPGLSVMNVSWSDLNNVQEAGEYSFRNGTISVTFAEVAIWKLNPGAQFQLMRKHPIQVRINYVLGKQMEQKP